MQQIALAPYFTEYTLVDDADYPELSKYRWTLINPKDLRKKKYVARTWIDNKKVKIEYMHQHILGKIPGLDIDHIDGDGLNNQRSNLQHLKHADNVRRGKKQSKGSSQFRGVSKSATPGKWVAKITIPGKGGKQLGTFATELEAAQAYNDACDALQIPYQVKNDLTLWYPDGTTIPARLVRNESTPRYGAVIPLEE